VESSYRTAARAAAPPTALTYRAYGTPALIGFTAVFVWLFAFCVFLAVSETGTLTLDCSRASGLCTFVASNPVRATIELSRPIASIRGADVSTGRYGTCYLFVTAKPTLVGSLSVRSASCAERRGQKAAIDAFLADGSRPTLHVDCDRPSAVALLFLIAALATVVGGTFPWQRATVRFEWASGVVVLERSRWPLPPHTRSFLLDEVTGAEVRVRSWGGSRAQHYVALTLASGESVPLLGAWGVRTKPEQPAAAAAWIGHTLEHREHALRSRSVGA
jgi:hypothetical protein